jgi:hypothetical protein
MAFEGESFTMDLSPYVFDDDMQQLKYDLSGLPIGTTRTRKTT